MLTCVTNGMSSCMEAMNVTLGIYNQLNLREVSIFNVLLFIYQILSNLSHC